MLGKIIRENLTQKAKVIFKQRIQPNVFHIRVQSKYFKELNYVVGQHFHVLVDVNTVSLTKLITNRSYSIWHHNKKKGTIDMAICNFGRGPGSQWIEKLEKGDFIYHTKPTGKFTLSKEHAHHIFIGDVCTLSHFYNMAINLDDHQTFKGYVYETNEDNLFPDLITKTHFTFLKKNKTLNNSFFKLTNNIPSEELQQTMFYLGGDAAICIELNRMLKNNFQLNKNNITIKPFWKKDKKGL